MKSARRICSNDEFDWKELPTFEAAAQELGQLSADIDCTHPVEGKAMVVRGKVEHDPNRATASEPAISGLFRPETSGSAATQRNRGKAGPQRRPDLDDALYFVVKTDKEIWIVVNGTCIPGYERGFLLSDEFGNEGKPIKHDVMRCNSALAQELFPPKGDTINVKAALNTHDIRVYDWETKDGWTVFVCPNDNFYIHRLLKAKL